ncbi:MAG: hypothetical protein PW791_13200 [Neorhizobium sp.]|nr:hypothetical protein [Neorhizobium sp.]
MPVSLPDREPTDPRMLALLQQIANADGALALFDEEITALERQGLIEKAENDGLIRIDQGGEWTSGGVLFITNRGLVAIGLQPRPGVMKQASRFLDQALRRFGRRANG